MIMIGKKKDFLYDGDDGDEEKDSDDENKDPDRFITNKHSFLNHNNEAEANVGDIDDDEDCDIHNNDDDNNNNHDNNDNKNNNKKYCMGRRKG